MTTHFRSCEFDFRDDHIGSDELESLPEVQVDIARLANTEPIIDCISYGQAQREPETDFLDSIIARARYELVGDES